VIIYKARERREKVHSYLCGPIFQSKSGRGQKKIDSMLRVRAGCTKLQTSLRSLIKHHLFRSSFQHPHWNQFHRTKIFNCKFWFEW